MSRSIRNYIYGFAALLTTALSLLSSPATAQPLAPSANDAATPCMHLFLPSQFIESIRENRVMLARARYYLAEYNHAMAQNQPEAALACTDSLIRISEKHGILGRRLVDWHKNSAKLLHANGEIHLACVAYDRSISAQDSLMRLAQSQTIREMQESYQLDRLALDQALLRARHHQMAMIYMSLLLLAIVAGVAFAYFTNRRIKRLHQELLLQMKHSEESEQKKLAFINTICHEVRTPLNCIAGFSELMTAEDIDAEAYGQYCEIIRDNCHQLRDLFDDMLEVAFLENLQDSLPRNYLDLSALCRTQLHAMKIKFPKQGVVYKSEIPAEEIGICTNPKYLTMLISLLLGNAYKFTDSGFVSIECGRDTEDRAFIAVADTGCGIPAEMHEYVFERFTKLDSFSTGNGLGLYLARLIVRHLGGKLRIDPDYEGGTRFVAVLPRK